MFRNRVLVDLFILWLVIGTPAFAQTNSAVSGMGHDYFTADQDGIAEYLRILTGAHVNTIPGWIQQGRIDNAVADVKYSLDHFPNHPQALQMLGMVARLAKNISLAVNYFERAVTLYLQYAITWAQYGVFLMGISNIDAGIAKFKKSIELEPKLPGYAGMAHAYAKKGDMAKARETFEKARELGFTGPLPPGL